MAMVGLPCCSELLLHCYSLHLLTQPGATWHRLSGWRRLGWAFSHQFHTNFPFASHLRTQPLTARMKSRLKVLANNTWCMIVTRPVPGEGGWYRCEWKTYPQWCRNCQFSWKRSYTHEKFVYSVLDLKHELPRHTQTHELKAWSPAADVILRSGGSFTFCSS